MATSPFRADAGVQTAQTASWQGATGVPGLYYNSTTGWMARKPDNSEFALGGSAVLGNYTFTGSLMDLSVAGTMALGTGNSNTTSFTVGSASTGPILFNGTRLRMNQAVQSGVTAVSALSIIGGAHTNMTASTEYLAENHQLNQTYQWATGAIATQRHVLYQAPTYAFVGSSTITNAATLAISGPPVAGTNATLTSAWALWLQSGNLGFGPNAAIGQSSASATNTTAMAFNVNVADGASSVGLAVKNSAATTSAVLMAWLTSTGGINGQVELDTILAGSFVIRQPSTTYMGFFDSGNNGFKIQAGSTYFRSSGADQFQVSGTDFFPVAAGSQTLGATNAFGRITSTRYAMTNQVIAAATSITVNPASGSYVRINLSATAITSMTISAGSNGDILIVEVVEDATGTRTIPTTWTNVSFNAGSYTASAGANKHDLLMFIYNSTFAKWVEICRSVGDT